MSKCEPALNGDLIAAEAKFRKNCFSLYVLKKGSLAQYQGILASRGVDAMSYTKQHLNTRIKKHFGDKTVQLTRPSRPVPKQWTKHIQNPQNKTNLCDFLTSSFSKHGQEQLPQGKRMIIGGGFVDGEKAVSNTRSCPIEAVEDLKSNQEEADTWMILHAAFAAQQLPAATVVIQTLDTDILILCIAHFTIIGGAELWFCTGVRDRQHYIPVHAIKTWNLSVSASIPCPHWV